MTDDDVSTGVDRLLDLCFASGRERTLSLRDTPLAGAAAGLFSGFTLSGDRDQGAFEMACHAYVMPLDPL